VEKIASLENIQLRTGCFCNPGACQSALGLTDDEVKEHLERGHVCWDEHDLIDGRPTGLVRVSLGWMSTWEDATAFVTFVRKHFVSTTPLQVRYRSTRPRRYLEAIYVYPIKSCAPQRAGAPPPTLWPLGPSGLAYDREWAVVDRRDRALRLKQVRFSCWPRVTLEQMFVCVKCPSCLHRPR
ncbi:unnamed protein product, partial [Ectocarpus sp. 12 AP-2014]